MADGTALLLIDLQHDFVDHGQLFPPAHIFLSQMKMLLSCCRAAGIPVIHVRTIIRGDGSRRMPHWLRNNDRRCQEGTCGADPPEGLESFPHEQVFEKTFYSAFTNPGLNEFLRREGMKKLLIAGVHTHSCVHATVLDAYQLGYDVNLVVDAIASYSPLHAELTIKHLADRACECVTTSELFPDGFKSRRSEKETSLRECPTAFINGEWIRVKGNRLWEMRDPCCWDRIIAVVPIAGPDEVSRAATLSGAVQCKWADTAMEDRLRILRIWSAILEEKRGTIIQLIISEVGKPRREAEAEFAYALRLLRGSVHAAGKHAEERLDDDVIVRYAPRGVIALITPWNNPLALPVGKLAPALAFGNTVVWKPAIQSPALAGLIVEALHRSGLPPNCLNVLFGETETARRLLECPQISAVSFTGSEDAGREISAVCGLRNISLQAELGGNNGALVIEDADLAMTARDLAHSVFSFSGQRCTAPRRIIVVEEVRNAFVRHLIEEVHHLKIGDPFHSETHIGPLISRTRQAMMSQWVRKALEEGGRLLIGGNVPAALVRGCWFEPTIIADLSTDSFLVQEETFGPLAVLLSARNFEHGVELVNAVRHGLRAIVYTKSQSYRDGFIRSVKTGLIHINVAGANFHVDAPFGGWKTSGAGIPEHGRWDRDFYTHVQTVYE